MSIKNNFKKPKLLQKWDLVVALSLSWWWPWSCPERYEIWKRQFEKEFWVKVIEWKYTKADAKRLYQHPEARAEDLMDSFKNPKIKAIISTIWWEESIRILPYIDFNTIKNNHKIFMWYSDTTISHFICQKAWIISFYGPSIMAWFAENGWMFPYMIDSVNNSIFTPNVIWEIKPNKDWWTNEFLPWDNPNNQNIKRKLFPAESRRWIQWSGIHHWRLIGWCIDVFPFIQGTEIRPSKYEWEGKILVMETSEEKMNTITFERIIRNLWSQWILHQISWILLGRVQYDYQNKTTISYDECLLKVINDELGIFWLPIITNMDFWHTDPMFILPLWCEADIDCDKQKFIIKENACVV